MVLCDLGLIEVKHPTAITRLTVCRYDVNLDVCMMLHQQKNNPLALLIEGIWQRRVVRKSATDVPALSDENWLLLGGWNAAACFGPPTGKLTIREGRIEIADDWGKLLFLCAVARDGDPLEQCAQIDFLGTPISLAVTHFNEVTPKVRLRHDPWALIIALELITYHLDSALLKPRDLREDDLADFAIHAGLERGHFRRLCSWHSQILPHL
jgi:hypothetical protein